MVVILGSVHVVGARELGLCAAARAAQVKACQGVAEPVCLLPAVLGG